MMSASCLPRRRVVAAMNSVVTIKIAAVLGLIGLSGATGCSSLPQHWLPLPTAAPVATVESVPNESLDEAASATMTQPVPTRLMPSTHSASSTSTSMSAPTRTRTPNATAIAPVAFTRHACPQHCGQCPTCRNAMPSGDACQSCPPGTATGPLYPPPWRVDPQEFLCDGGDQPPRAYWSAGDQIENLDPEDTVTKYVTESGDVELTASNRVCVYSPRFGSVRQITAAVAGEKAVAAVGVDRRVGPVGINLDLPGLVVRDAVSPIKQQRTQRLDSMRDRNRGVIVDMVQQPIMQVDFLAVLAGVQNTGLSMLDDAQLALIRQHAVAAVQWSIDESVEIAIEDLKAPVLTRDQKVDALVVYDFPDAGRLNLIKLVDRRDAALGDTATFFLRLQNVGDSPVSNVDIADNLTTRLEYVADSSRVIDPETGEEIDASLEVTANAVGSSKLTWTIPGQLDVGDMVEIRFECLVR